MRNRKEATMKKTILAFAATLAMAFSAVAADLPSRTAPAAPVYSSIPYPTPWYVGVQAGVTAGTSNYLGYGNDSNFVLGVVGGYEFNPFLRGELNFVNRFSSNGLSDGQALTANVIGQYAIPGTAFTPYVLGGIGYGWNLYGQPFNNGSGAPHWNIGAGVRYALNQNWEVDARYRYLQQFSTYFPLTDKLNENIVTLGVNYRF